MKLKRGPRLRALLAHAKPWRDRVSGHRLYERLEGLESARVFMEHHVYAVWDFMSLVKSLQGSLTCVTTPWRPTGDPLMRRMLNEMVLDEESDEDGRGGYRSHFEIYLEAMRELGADSRPAETLIRGLERGLSPRRALAAAGAPPAARAFVATTLGIVASGEPHRVAAAFAVGREEVIPAMFRRFTSALRRGFPDRTRRFAYYLDRHVDVDGDRHRPMALRALETLCGSDPRKWREARESAVAALAARERLWDAAAAEIEARSGARLRPR